MSFHKNWILAYNTKPALGGFSHLRRKMGSHKIKECKKRYQNKIS